jgi:hypothetical protein
VTTWIELLVVVALIAVALAGTPWLRVAHAIGVARVVFVVALALLVLGAQFSPRPSEPYPATTWFMYTVAIDSVRFAEVRLLVGGLDVGPVPIPRSAEPRPFLGRLLNLASDAAEGDQHAAHTLDETLRALVAGLAGPSDRIVVRRCEVRAPTPVVPRRCTDMWTTMVDPVSP